MKNFRIKKRISDYFNTNKWQILIVLASVFAGIMVGSLFSIRISPEKYNEVESYIKNFISAYGLQSVDCNDILKFSIYNNSKMVLFLWFSGIWVWFLPIGLVQIGLKGYKIGFSTTIFVKIFGIKGIIFAIISVLPQILFMLPMMIYYVINIKFAFSLNRIRFQHASSNLKNQLYIKNLICFVIAIGVAVVSGLVDAYIIPPILKPVCAFLNS